MNDFGVLVKYLPLWQHKKEQEGLQLMIKAKEEEVETQNISGPSSPDTNAPCDSQYDRSSVVDTLTEK